MHKHTCSPQSAECSWDDARLYPRLLLPVIILLLYGYSTASASDAYPSGQACPPVQELPLPSNLPLYEYEQVFGAYLDGLCYRNANWARDKSVRNTGPHLAYRNDSSGGVQWSSVSSGTHESVSIFYSPAIYQWVLLREKRAARAQLAALDKDHGKDGGLVTKQTEALPAIPNGAMILKEMWKSPAHAYGNAIPEVFEKDGSVNPEFSGWAITVKDSGGSWDGWFWGYYLPAPSRGLAGECEHGEHGFRPVLPELPRVHGLRIHLFKSA